MNLKYYLRGLGVGIVVTAVIMGIALGGKKQELSNEEIKERAKELGMVEESTVLADAAANLQAELNKENENDKEPEAVPTRSPEPTAEPTPEATQKPMPSASIEPSATPSPIKTSEPSAEPTTEKTSEPSQAPASEPAVVPTEKPAQTNGGEQNTGTVTIQINSGDGSLTVSRKLEQAGLVASATDFDLYLCQNGYDKRLNVGTFEVPVNADQEQIAKILARIE